MQVVVNQNLACRRCQYGFSHRVDALYGVEVQATDDVGFGNQLVGKLLIAVVQENVFTAGHPFQKIGKSVGHNDCGGLVLRAEEVPQPQRRTDGVSVGGNVRYDDKLFSTLKPFAEMVYIGLLDYFAQHVSDEFTSVF